VSQIICISRGTHSGGIKLAKRLAEKLDYACLSREELIDAATQEGIQVGKLEMSMIKAGIFSDRLSLERDHYLAFTTAYLCDKAIEGGLVYHGRTGHLLLPGVSHVLRVRVLADEEFRIEAVMRTLGLDRKKARRYIEEVDEDRRRWVHFMYGISWEDAAHYDIVLNLAQISLENAATMLVNISQMPDFQMTPASKKLTEDLRLAATARLRIARDERTHGAAVKVRADNGVVNVTYLPQDTKVADAIPEICSDLPGMKEIRSTMAMTNLLWIQEEFEPESELYDEVVEIARKWNAAVELIRSVPDAEEPGLERVDAEAGTAAMETASKEYNGGIEEDVPDTVSENGGLKSTLDALAGIGRSGGGRVIYGDPHQLTTMLARNVPYSLVVIGDMFLSKGHAARLRAIRDLQGFLNDHIRAPVVTADELGSHYLFGKRDVVRTLAFLAAACILYFLVFTNQEPILAFLSQSGWYAESIDDTFLSKIGWLPKIIVSVAVFLFVPLVAYFYSNVTASLLKLIKME
jgi:cytidylate kinase